MVANLQIQLNHRDIFCVILNLAL